MNDTITTETSTQFIPDTTTSISPTAVILSDAPQLCSEISSIILSATIELPKVNIQTCKKCNKEGWVQKLEFSNGEEKDRLCNTRFGIYHLDCLPPIKPE